MSETNDKNSKGKKVDCEAWEKLEKYKILCQAYADEIKNLWQRSIFLGAFMTLAWGGYGALQVKFIDKWLEIKNLTCTTFNFNPYHCLSFGLCAVIIVLSLLWIAMAKGSKFVQEAHESCIDKFIKKNKDLKELFCNLNEYEYLNSNKICGYRQRNPKLSGIFGIFSAFRYSPSKINIALGWLSLIASFILLNIHILLVATFSSKILFITLFCACVIALFIRLTLKGGCRNLCHSLALKIISILQLFKNTKIIQNLFKKDIKKMVC